MFLEQLLTCRLSTNSLSMWKTSVHHLLLLCLYMFKIMSNIGNIHLMTNWSHASHTAALNTSSFTIPGPSWWFSQTKEMQTSLWWNWPVNKQFDHSRANGCHKAPGHPKHFRLDCLIFQCVKCLFATKQAVFMEAVPVLTPYCSQSLKVTVNQKSQLACILVKLYMGSWV